MSNDDPRNLAGALAWVQSKLPEVPKSETAHVRSDKGSYSYSYANLAQVSKKILPLLGEAGLAFIAKPMFNAEGKFVLSYKLLHVSGEAETGEYPLPQSATAQQLGSAITYARRYTLCSITGVAPDQDDDDAAAGSEASTQRRTAQRRTQRQQEQPAAAPERPARTAQRARPAGPPLPGEDGYDDAPAAKDTKDAPVTRAQLDKLHVQLGEFDIKERDDKLTTVGLLVRRQFGSSLELTKTEASGVIDLLERLSGEDDRIKALDAVLASLESAEDAGSDGDQ